MPTHTEDTPLPLTRQDIEEGIDILIVDDDPIVLTGLQRLLQKRGYRVTTAGDVPTALQKLCLEPSVIICDWVLKLACLQKTARELTLAAQNHNIDIPAVHIKSRLQLHHGFFDDD